MNAQDDPKQTGRRSHGDRKRRLRCCALRQSPRGRNRCAGVLASVAVAAAILSLSACAGQLDALRVADGFEGRQINVWRWDTTWLNRDAATITTAVQHSGRSALRVWVEPGDHRMWGRSGQATERSELIERPALAMGQEAYYTFAVYVPEDFPIVPQRLVIAQWKQESVQLWLKRSPVIAVRFTAGRLWITTDTADGQRTLYSQGTAAQPALVGRWTRFTARVRFAPGADGELDLWLDDRQVVTYRGSLAYTDDIGRFRLRIGLYRDALPTPMSVYFDSYSRSDGGEPPWQP